MLARGADSRRHLPVGSTGGGRGNGRGLRGHPCAPGGPLRDQGADAATCREPRGARRSSNREARITSLLQHPNIVQVIDHNTAPDGTEYLVMEYLAGESLSQRLAREGRLPLDTVVGHHRSDRGWTVGRPRAAASCTAISSRTTSSWSPSRAGRPSWSRSSTSVSRSGRGSLEVSGMVCGTPQYMAPEQVEGRVLDVDASTDQFALAVIAHEMLTGRNPFQGDNVEAIFSRVSSDVPMSVGLGEGVDAVLARALAKSSAQRFARSRSSPRPFGPRRSPGGRANRSRRPSRRPTVAATTSNEGNASGGRGGDGA